jgi:hypothetical protein
VNVGQQLECRHQAWFDVGPVRLAVVDAERRHCHRLDVEFTRYADEINEAGFDVGQL